MLCDFGLARTMDDFPSGLTTTRFSMGTCRYASPEVALFNKPRTLESDMWSWGCLFLTVRSNFSMPGRPDSYEKCLLQIASDCTPYGNEMRESSIILAMHQRKRPADALEFNLPTSLLRLLRKCWSWLPDGRPNAHDCLSNLEETSFDSDDITETNDFDWAAFDGPEEGGRPLDELESGALAAEVSWYGVTFTASYPRRSLTRLRSLRSR